MKYTAKISAGLLALLMLGQSLSACGKQAADAADGTQAKPETETKAAEELRYLDTLESRDMEGFQYRIVAQHSETRPNFLISEEVTGEVVNDAIHTRDNALENRLNIELVRIPYADRGVLKSDVTKSLMANSDEYDLIITAFSDGINSMTTQNLLMDLTTIPHITLDSQYWNKSISDYMRFNGKQFFTSGPVSVSYLYTPTHVLVNRDLAKELQLPDMQELVMEGKWTIDMMASMMKDAAYDLNGDGNMKMPDDRFAAIWGHTFGNEMYLAAGLHAVQSDSSGNWTINIDDADSVDFILKCADLFSDKSKMLVFTGTNVDHYKVFTEGRLLFIDSTVANTIFYVRGMEQDFGILPIPVLNEGDPYLTECNTWLPSGIAVPITATDTERLGLIMETMAVYSYDYLLPAVAEKTLGKVSHTNTDYQILTMTFNNASFELNTIMDFGGSSQLLRSACFGAVKNFASSYEKIHDAAQKALDDFLAAADESD
ncbi:MAG: hypothetical protein E7604_05535 [Ruminococcaceae bacterium]|nr:hypothetical protein [Oscillospiraceae bacterium]